MAVIISNINITCVLGRRIWAPGDAVSDSADAVKCINADGPAMIPGRLPAISLNGGHNQITEWRIDLLERRESWSRSLVVTATADDTCHWCGSGDHVDNQWCLR